MKARIIILIMLSFVFNSLIAQKRFSSPVFQQVDSLKEVPFGAAKNIKGVDEVLLMDIFQPSNDRSEERALPIYCTKTL